MQIFSFLLEKWNTFLRILQAFYISWFAQKEKVVEETNAMKTTRYVNKQLELLKPIWDKISGDTVKNVYHNENINKVFYNKKQLQDCIKEEGNDLEKEWKRRILFEHTPRGNVIMYYDVYKIGFSYYSDQFIPYSILNAVAAKYVITYRCMDFFLDELVRPENVKSPLIKLFTEEKKNENEELDGKDNKKEKYNPMKTSRNRFARFKSYNMTSSKIKETEEKDTEKEITMNRFIQLGKIANFSFLQKPVPIKKGNVLFSNEKSDLQKGLFDNSDVQKEVFSYRDFKRAVQSTSSFTK